MNPSKINRQKILKKFNIEKYNDQEEPIESEPLLEQSSSPYIELQLNSEINDDIKKNVVLSPDITSRLPSVLDYKNAYKDDYFHKLSEILNKTPINFISNKVINISIFNIYKQKHVIPSILFLLYKNNDKLFFPNFTSTQNVDISVEKKLDSIFDNYKIKPEYIGFLEDDKNIYVFYQYKEKYEVSEVKRSSAWWWATISEIVNYRKILNYEIATYIYNLFVKNPFIYRLFDKNNKVFPIGNTVFYGGHQNYISFISTLGLPKESPTSNLGPYYYFYSYYGAGRRAIWSQNRKQKIINGKDITRNEYGVYDRGGIVRFSIFGNSPKFFLNKEFDKVNYLIIKKNKELKVNTNLYLKNINLKRKDFLKMFFPEVKAKINLNNQKIKIEMPIVIRLAGTNVEKGNKILKDSGVSYIEAQTLEEAANKAVEALKKVDGK